LGGAVHLRARIGQGNVVMDSLKIARVELDDQDPYRATFNLQLSRDMTNFERQALRRPNSSPAECKTSNRRPPPKPRQGSRMSVRARQPLTGARSQGPVCEDARRFFGDHLALLGHIVVTAALAVLAIAAAWLVLL
jgi:hypothetical protein